MGMYSSNMTTVGYPASSTNYETRTIDTSTTKLMTSSRLGLVTTTNAPVINVTSSAHAGDDALVCNGWLDAQHAVFQLANLCILISFLTPSTFKHHCFFLRIMLNIGHLLVVIWAALFVCMPDILSWNAAFFVCNSFHLVYLGYRIVPERFSKTLEDVYVHTFKPLRVTRRQFKDLVELGNMALLAKGAIYARQGQNQTGLKLSILIKGRLKVSYNDIYLHSVDVNQFVDSPEFDNSAAADREELFQVTISAIDDSLLFTWPYKQLKDHLNSDAQMCHMFRQIIGKDISGKLYEIQERVVANPNYMSSIGRRSSMVNVRHSIVSSSAPNLTKLNCLQGCVPSHDEQPDQPPSNGSFETSV